MTAVALAVATVNAKDTVSKQNRRVEAKNPSGPTTVEVANNRKAKTQERSLDRRLARTKDKYNKGVEQPVEEHAVAGGPINDNCQDAVSISDGATTFTTVDALTDGLPNALCLDNDSDQINQDIWYNYTSSCTGFLQVNVCTAGFDTRLAVYDGNSCTGNILACNDDICGLQSQVSNVSVTQGSTYKIRVGGYLAASGTGTINLSCTPDAGGDGQTCDQAQPIFDGVTAFTTVGATTDGAGDALCNFFGNNQVNQDIWYEYTATCDGVATVSLCGSLFDTKAAIYDGDGCVGQILDCDDDSCSTQSQLAAQVTEGNVYKIRVGGFGVATGTGIITIACGEGGDNEVCAGSIEAFTGATAFTTVGSTTDGPPNTLCTDVGGSQQVNQDIWYHHTATCDGTLTVSLCGSGYDTKLAVYDGLSCVGTILGCNDDSCGLQSSVAVAANIGDVVKIRIGGYMAATGNGTMTISCTETAGNDSCPGASEVTDGTYSFSTVGATTDGPPNSACTDVGGNQQVNQDVWFNYVATCDGNLIVTLCGSLYDTKLGLYDSHDCVGSILGCNDDSCGLQSVVSAPVTLGQAIKIRAGGYMAATGMGTLNISCLIPAGNDNCDGATEVTDGQYSFSTIGATTDGQPDAICAAFGDNNVNQDIWFNYVATCSQTLTAELCGSLYDTKIAIYDTDACTGDILACNDDACGLQSRAMSSVTEGQIYKIRVGGFGGATGTGTLTITCGAGPCDAGVGDCCTAHGGIGCEDPACCSLVCGCDPFCCETEWDAFCAGTGFVAGCGAQLLCEDQPCFIPPPENDDCVDSIPITQGVTGYSNVGTTNDGPELPGDCDEGFGLAFGSDVWFTFQSDCTGTLSVSTCNDAGYDTRMSMYHTCSCPVSNDVIAGCNDDGVGCGLTSNMEAFVTEGECYLIRVGGFAGAQGAGNITISCDPVNTACIGGIGTCLEAQPTPGCDDPICCDEICDGDSFCCDVEWDGTCAAAANILCVPPINDECEDAPIEQLPHTYTGSNLNADPDCGLFSPPPDQVWIAFELTEDSSLVLDYCGTGPAFGNAWLNLALGCPCTGFTDAGAFNLTSCGDGNVTITWQCLPAGIYYYPVLTETGSEGLYTINVNSGACIDPCAGATGDCYSPHPDPGCEDSGCCNIICDFDPFCCNTSWDEICVDEANDFCAGVEPPVNDLCANSIDVSEGTYDFTNAGAGNDGPALPGSCDEGFGLFFGADIWYDYTPTLSGDATIDVCDAGYDARMSVYEGCNCPATNANFVACNDDGCGDVGGPSTLSFAATAGTCYKVRIGGYDGATGSGSFTISLSGVDCPAGGVTFTNPPSGAVDARQDGSPAGGPLQGITTVTATGPSGAPAGCWTFCETSNGGLAPNAINSVTEGPAGTYSIALARPITPGAVSTVRYLGNNATATYISHPANANGDSLANSVDILRLIDYINGVATAPWGQLSTDIDRSNATNPADILRLIDLLNGAGELEVWNATPLPTNPGSCP